ncbi:MAG: hypothetical protein ACM4D3_14875 [Candidatus Sericytochromatia bacterium]
MSPTAVGLVLVEGDDADGEIMMQDGFDVPTRRGAIAMSTSDYVAGAMSRTRAMAHGRRPHAIGVTWAEDSEFEASLLLKSLSAAGFDNVVAVRSEEAGEALARGIGRAVGYEQTAICLLEPEAVVVSKVDTYDDAVQTVSHHEHETDAELIDWLIRVFEVNEWRPECLIVVGPDNDLGSLTKDLETALSIPVFAPPQADLALARGAALASAQNPEFTFGDAETDEAERPRGWRWPLPYTAALTMLAAGVLTFVVSIAFAAGFRLSSNSGPDAGPAQRPSTTQQAPPVAEAVPSAVPTVGLAPSTVPALEPIVTAKEQVSVPDGVRQDAAGEAVSAPEATGPEFVPPPPAPDAPPPTVSDAKPPLLTRILSHIPGLHDDPPPAAPAPAPAP